MATARIFFLLLLPAALFAQSAVCNGAALLADRRYAEAEHCFLAVIRADPYNTRAIESLGDLHAERKQWQRAADYYAKLLALADRNADYHFKHGAALSMVAVQSGRLKAFALLDDIRNAFLKAIQLDPAHIQARWALVEYYLQVPAIAGGSEKKAARYANELASFSPVDGFLAKGRIAEYFKRFRQAEACYRSAIHVGRSRTCYQKLADLYKNHMKRPDKAKEVMNEYHNLSKT